MLSFVFPTVFTFIKKKSFYKRRTNFHTFFENKKIAAFKAARKSRAFIMRASFVLFFFILSLDFLAFARAEATNTTETKIE